MKKIDKTINLFDLSLFSNKKRELLSWLENRIEKADQLTIVFTPNPEQVVQAHQNPKFKQSLQQADVLIPDGIGLVMASKLLSLKSGNQSLTERIPGVEVVADLLERADRQGYKVLLIGGRGYDPARLPQQNFVWTPGYLNVQQPTPAEQDAIEYILAEFQPDMVFVAFGAPWQEEWILNHKSQLAKHNVKLAMAVGGSFDYLTGKVGRAPGVIRQIGVEWFYRLLRQPWRAKRQTRLLTFLGLTWQELGRKRQ